jgi:putative ABC transport system permease protein
MFKNYWTIAWRNIFKHKGYALIKTIGLALGIACCLLIFLHVRREWSYDRYHRDGDRIFRVAQKIQRESTELNTARVATPLIPALRESFPEVESAARFQLATWDSLVERGETKSYEDWVMIAESDVFDVFTIPFKRGRPETALDRRLTVVITERIAQKYFGRENPVGQPLVLWGKTVEVTGVVEDCPKNTHLKYDVIISLKSFEKTWNLDNWGWTGFYAYVKLKPHVDPRDFERKIRHLADTRAGRGPAEGGESSAFSLQPMASIHLHSHLVSEIGSPGDPRQVLVVSVLGMLILILSCINFINLETARSANRAKEVGVRKAVGAVRGQLIPQFLFESILVSLASSAVALLFAVLALPHFDRLTGQSLGRHDVLSPAVLMGLLGLSLFVGLMAGCYPAFLISRFRPASALKSRRGPDSGGNVLRKALVTLQYSVTIALMIGTLSVDRQVRFMKNAHPGFDKSQKLIVPVDTADMKTRYEAVKNEFVGSPFVTGASACWNVPGRLANLIEARLVEEPEENAQSMNFYYVDADFFPEYKIEMVAGRPFQKMNPADVVGVFVLNESAAKAFDFASPEEALGKRMYEGGSGGVGTIVGVAKDFHYKGLQTRVEPLALQWKPGMFEHLSLTVKTEDLPRTISFVEDKWKELRLGRLFTYFFLDEDFGRLYGSEESLGRLSATMTFLAVFLSCMGLAGLSAFVAEQRTKELGIRKVLGASSPGLWLLLVSEFTKWVLLANVIAWPLSYVVIHRWLQGFAYRANVAVWIFGLSTAAAFFIAPIYVSYGYVRAAPANPLRVLRYE